MSKYDEEEKYWRITDAMNDVEFDGVSVCQFFVVVLLLRTPDGRNISVVGQ